MNETDKSEGIELEKQNEYGDILYIRYLKSTKFRHMSKSMRAAQFAPFAALSGHKEIMSEIARETEKEKELDLQRKEEINYSLTLLKERLKFGENVHVTVKFFKADKKKSGGEYIEISGEVEKIDEMKNRIVFNENYVVSISDIIDLGI